VAVEARTMLSCSKKKTKNVNIRKKRTGKEKERNEQEAVPRKKREEGTSMVIRPQKDKKTKVSHRSGGVQRKGEKGGEKIIRDKENVGQEKEKGNGAQRGAKTTTEGVTTTPNANSNMREKKKSPEKKTACQR